MHPQLPDENSTNLDCFKEALSFYIADLRKNIIKEAAKFLSAPEAGKNDCALRVYALMS